MSKYEHLEVEPDGPVARVWLNRPEVRNAFNPALIAELTDCLSSVGQQEGVRVVVLGGRGKMFSAGGDLAWMRGMVDYSAEENLADARRLTDMLRATSACPCPVVCRVQGGAMGGGMGIMACCDSVICTTEAVFALSEVRVGLSPATITPYVAAKIGYSHIRDLALSGERFDAQRALSIGLVHQVVPETELDAAVEAKVSELLKAGPEAAAATKALLRDVAGAISPEDEERGAQLIAGLRVSREGQEGLSAFVQKRKPDWRMSED
ncbi:enoyl-CoA hydratase/isomerase family protein [bacterium]|nr:enoyl-CoA hydratase/isomerase family protein [bacterium]